jgi:hypothetical protein
MVGEPGLDLHEWETRWSELQEAASEDPAGALPEIARLVREMLEGRGYQLDEPVTAEGQDLDAVRDFRAAREVADRASIGGVDPGDVAMALENLREIYQYLTSERRAP